MIVTRLIGGLGNQMFQYAYGLGLANRCGQRLFLDVSAFETYNLHALAIDNLQITAARLSNRDQTRVPGRYRGKSRIGESLTSLLSKVLPYQSRPLRLRREKPFGLRAEYVGSAKDLYLDGYWQGEAFFSNMREELRREFRLANPISDATKHIEDSIAAGPSVSVHVRRGDYITDSETKRIYRSLEANYYRSCLMDLQKRFPKLKVYLFSNDVDWCTQNLDVGLPFEAVTHNNAQTAHEDMYLMSRCDHAIIANSSFSWWGAFLGEDCADRRVYYPEPWFNPGTLNGSALGCNDWVSEQAITHNQNSRAA